MSTAEGVALSDAFERIASELPYEPEFAQVEIVTTTARKHGAETALSVMVDREGGVDMQLCERVAARINAGLEAFSDLYTLEVESAGLNRPLTKPDDYERFAGRDVRIVTTLAIERAKTHRGKLVGLSGTNVRLETPRGELPIPLDVIRTANIEYDIRADLSRAKKERRQHEC